MIKLNEILNNLDCDFQVYGVENEGVGFCSIFEPIVKGITWIRAKDSAVVYLLNENPVSIVFSHELENSIRLKVKQTLIVVKNPHLQFMNTVRRFTESDKINIGIHPTAIISPRAKIGKDVSIGPFVEIGDCIIGDRSVIKSQAKIHSKVEIGEEVLVSEFCNIGGEGFGYIKNEYNKFENQPHIGKVIIENGVSIFPYTNVDRGTLGTTIVGEGTKIDHYCHIGHNTKIGKNNLITPNVTTLGGVVIGDDCMIGCGTQFRENIVVGNRVTIGMSSTLTKNVPDDETWVGSPAVEISVFKNERKKGK